MPKVDPRVMTKALELAGGDERRLKVRLDGSVVVANHPRPAGQKRRS